MTNANAATRQRRPTEECGRLGEAIYERDIEPLVKDDHDGEYVSIDVDTGVWAISDDLMTAAKLLREKSPDAVDVWGVRVGYVAVASLGGGAPPRRG